MRKNFVLFMLIFMIFVQGCATTSEITSSKGTIKIGMTKADVLSIWGEPEGKDIIGETYVQGMQLGSDERYELWNYPRINWWGAHTFELQFNKNGILTYIEPLYK